MLKNQETATGSIETLIWLKQLLSVQHNWKFAAVQSLFNLYPRGISPKYKKNVNEDGLYSTVSTRGISFDDNLLKVHIKVNIELREATLSSFTCALQYYKFLSNEFHLYRKRQNVQKLGFSLTIGLYHWNRAAATSVHTV